MRKGRNWVLAAVGQGGPFRPLLYIRGQTPSSSASACYADGKVLLAGITPAGSDLLFVALKSYYGANFAASFGYDLLNNSLDLMAFVRHRNAGCCGSEQFRKALSQPIIATRPDFNCRTM